MSGEKCKSSENILKLFECPVCFNRISPPVKVCNNGHAVCKKCQDQLEICPICKSSFSQIKNTTLDNVLEEWVFPCKNSGSGCRVEMKLPQIEHHEEEFCKHRMIGCLLNSCQDQVRASMVGHHLLNRHAPTPIEGKITRDISCKENHQTTAFLHSRTNSLIIEVIKPDLESKTIFITYFLIGSTKEADNLLFEIEFKAENNLESLKYRSLLSPLWCDKDDMSREGRYFKLGFEILGKFIIDGSLKFTLKLKPKSIFQYLKTLKKV